MNTILSNAVSSIQLGVEDYESPDPRRMLSAIRNLSAGLLLLFKERLRELSPPDSDDVLIMQEIRPILRPDGTIYFTGSKRRTVDVKQIRERFDSLQVKVDWKRFEALSTARNNAEHFYLSLPAARLKEILSDAMHIMHAFIRDELRREPVELLGSETWRVLLALADIHDSEQTACSIARSKIDWGDPLIRSISDELRCVHCDSKLLMPDETSSDSLAGLTFLCIACGTNDLSYQWMIEPAVRKHLFRDLYLAYTDGGEMPIVECPSCEKDTFVWEQGICAACGYAKEAALCQGCGEIFSPADLDDQELCELCSGIAHVSNRD